MTVFETRTRSHWAALAAVILGAGWLVARPTLLRAGGTASMLAIGYATTAAVALLAAVPTQDRPILKPSVGLLIGLVAITAAVVPSGLSIRPLVHAPALLLTLLAALAEEIVFRRALYGWLARHGPVIAIIGSASLFAVVHIPAYGVAALPVDLGAGLLFSWQRWATGSWSVPALTHMTANCLVVLL